MGKRRHTTAQIIAKLREAEIELAKGQALGEVVSRLGIADQTYYRWRKENGQLENLVADQALDMAILKEAAYPNF